MSLKRLPYILLTASLLFSAFLWLENTSLQGIRDAEHSFSSLTEYLESASHSGGQLDDDGQSILNIYIRHAFEQLDPIRFGHCSESHSNELDEACAWCMEQGEKGNLRLLLQYSQTCSELLRSIDRGPTGQLLQHLDESQACDYCRLLKYMTTRKLTP